MADKHWTSRHIVQQHDEYVGYDEAGLEHCRSHDRDTVVAALVAHALYLDRISYMEAELAKTHEALDHLLNLSNEMDAIIEQTKALGFYSESFDSSSDHKALCGRVRQWYSEKQEEPHVH